MLSAISEVRENISPECVVLCSRDVFCSSVRQQHSSADLQQTSSTAAVGAIGGQRLQTVRECKELEMSVISLAASKELDLMCIAIPAGRSIMLTNGQSTRT